MSIAHFDENYLRAAIRGASYKSALALAAILTERLYPAYASFVAKSGVEVDVVRCALDFVWDGLSSRGFDGSEVANLISVVESRLLSDEDAWRVGVPYAEDAIRAAWYMLKFCVNKDYELVVYSCLSVYDVADNAVNVQLEGYEFDETRILENPIMQEELSRLYRDLDFVCANDITPEQVNVLRDRAYKEAQELAYLR